MGHALDRHRLRRRRHPTGLILVCVILCGCSSTETTQPASDSWFTGRLTNLFGNEDRAQAPGTPTAPPPFDPRECPEVDIRTGAGTLAVATKTADATANDLRYQLTFHQTARRCRAQDGMLVIQVGVQGRVVLGPAGTPGQIEVPLRYALVREGVQPRTLATKFKRLPVTVAPGETSVQFTDVEEDLSAPMPSMGDIRSSVIYVGFDDLIDKKPPSRPAAKKSPPRAK